MSGISQRTFVSYIDRTREYYGAQGYEKPYVWARHAQAPFAPLSRPLAQACVALVTTASPWRDEKPVDGVLRGSKQVWSGPTDAPPERLFTDDLAWDKEATHTRDVESFLPIRRLPELADAGRIGGLAARFHATRCADESRPKPHPEMLHYLTQRLTEWSAANNPFFEGQYADGLALIPFSALIILLLLVARAKLFVPKPHA